MDKNEQEYIILFGCEITHLNLKTKESATFYMRRFYGAGIINLPDKTIFICGGGESKNKCEIYNPKTQELTYVGDMLFKRSDHAVALLPNNRILILGGRIDLDGVIETEIFNISTRTFTQGPNLLKERKNATACTLKNGKVLVCGGWGEHDSCYTSERYDPKSNKFVRGPGLKYHLYHHSGTRLLNGNIMLFGGFESPNYHKTFNTNYTEIYDLHTNKFIEGPEMLIHHYHPTCCLLSDGRVFICGNKSNITEYYDPQTNSFTEGPILERPYLEGYSHYNFACSIII